MNTRFSWSLGLAFVLSVSAAIAQPPPNYGDDPDAPIDMRFERAKDHHYRGEMEQAFAIYDEILAERPDDVPTIITYGNMLWKIGELDAAENRFKQAIALQPDHIKSRQWLGQLYVHRGQRAKAREQFDALLALDWVRENVRHSGILNLAKMDLQAKQWVKARKGFRTLLKEADKADRKSAQRGLKHWAFMRQLTNWPVVETQTLSINFSPKAPGLTTKEARRAFGQRLDAFVKSTCGRLKMPVPDKWPVYVFEDDGECAFKTGRAQAHGWDYSWWMSFIAVGSKYPPEHTIAVQLAARFAGSRPISRCIVEGFCAYLAGQEANPHGWAAEAYRQGKLPTIGNLHRAQKHPAQYEIGMSLVRYLIDTHGSEKFSSLWKMINTELNKPAHKEAGTKTIIWEDAFDALFKEHLGASIRKVEAGWHDTLKSS